MAGESDIGSAVAGESFAWTTTAAVVFCPVAGDRGYDPLFAYGFGLTTRDRATLPTLSEARGDGGG